MATADGGGSGGGGPYITERELKAHLRAMKAEFVIEVGAIVKIALAEICPVQASKIQENANRIDALQRTRHDEEIAKKTRLGVLQWLGIVLAAGGAGNAKPLLEAAAKLLGGP